MLPASSPQVQAYEDINDLFSGGTFVFITIEGDNKIRMAEAADAFVAEM